MKAVLKIAAACAMMMIPSPAGATSITVNLGYIAFTSFIGGGSNTFDVENLSGAVISPSSDFPLLDPLTFTQLRLTVNPGGGPHEFSLDDLGPGNLTIGSGAPPLDLQVLTSATFSSVILTGQFAIKGYELQDHTIFTPFTGGFSVAMLLTDGAVADGEIGLIFADGDLVQADPPPDPGVVPEPGTLLLVGTGIATAIRARRKK